MANRRNIWYYIQNYKFNSLFIRNLLLIFLLMVIPAGGIAVAAYANTNDLIRQQVTETSINSLYRVKDIVDTLFSDTERLATRISQETYVQVFMLSDDQEAFHTSIKKKILEKTNTYPLVYRYISSIYIYSDKNNYLIANTGGGDFQTVDDVSWYNAYAEKKDNDPWVQARRHKDVYPYYISIVKPAGLSYVDGKIGAVIINLNPEELGKILTRTENSVTEDIFILNKDGTILYNRDVRNITANVRDMEWFQDTGSMEGDYSGVRYIGNEKYIVVSVESGYHDGRYVSLIPFTLYQARLDRIKGFMIVLLGICFTASIAFAYILSVKTFRPVQNILSFVENPGEGFGSSVRKHKSDSGEIQYITERILGLIYSNKDLKDELDKRMSLMKKAQSTALQAQINPHFLYNTLENINWKSIRLNGGKNDVSKMLSLLSNLLRLSMDSSDPLIPMAREIEHAQCYLEIIKMRYEEKVTLVWNVEDQLLDYKIIKLSLQPLIENAVYHGIKPKRQGGTIHINGSLLESQIHLEVADDGVGMSPEDIFSLNNGLKEAFEPDSEHIGLRNVNQRIKLLFGAAYGITVTGTREGGASVKISIPAIK